MIFCFKEKLQNLSHLNNEILTLGLHAIIFLMSFDVKENFELLKTSVMAITTIIWISNSAFTFLSVII